MRFLPALLALAAPAVLDTAAFADAPPPPPRPIVIELANKTGWSLARAGLEQCGEATCAHASSPEALTCDGQVCSGYLPGLPAFVRLVLVFQNGRSLESGVFKSDGAEYRAKVTTTGILVQPHP